MPKEIPESIIKETLDSTPDWVFEAQGSFGVEPKVFKICFEAEIEKENVTPILYGINLVILGLYTGQDLFDTIKEACKDKDDNFILDLTEKITTEILAPLRKIIAEKTKAQELKAKPVSDSEIEFPEMYSEEDFVPLGGENSKVESSTLKQAGVDLVEPKTEDLNFIEPKTASDKNSELTKLPIPKKPKI